MPLFGACQTKITAKLRQLTAFFMFFRLRAFALHAKCRGFESPDTVTVFWTLSVGNSKMPFMLLNPRNPAPPRSEYAFPAFDAGADR